MTTVPLLQSVTARFDANGRALAELYNARAGQTWDITSLTVSSDSGLVPRLWVYRNFEQASNLIDSTQAANADRSELDNVTLGSAEKLLFVWDSGAPGKSGTVVIIGRIRGF